MTRHVLAAHLGPDDGFAPKAAADEVVTRFDLVAGQRSLGRGIGPALRALRDLGVRPTEIGVDLIVGLPPFGGPGLKLVHCRSCDDGRESGRR